MISTRIKKTRNKLDLMALKGKKYSFKEKYFPVFVLSILLVTTIVFLFPQFSKIKNTKTDLKTLEEKVEALAKQRQVFESVLSDNENFNRRFENTERYLPSVKPSLQTMINLSNLAKLMNVEFSGLTLNPGLIEVNADGTKKTKTKTDKNNLNSFEINFNVKGDQKSILEFIGKIKEISPIMKIVSVETSSDNNRITAKLDISVYYQQAPEELSLDQDIKLLSNEEMSLIDTLGTYLLSSDNFAAVDSEDIDYGVDYGVSNPFEAQ